MTNATWTNINGDVVRVWAEAGYAWPTKADMDADRPVVAMYAETGACMGPSGGRVVRDAPTSLVTHVGGAVVGTGLSEGEALDFLRAERSECADPVGVATGDGLDLGECEGCYAALATYSRGLMLCRDCATHEAMP